MLGCPPIYYDRYGLNNSRLKLFLFCYHYCVYVFSLFDLCRLDLEGCTFGLKAQISNILQISLKCERVALQVVRSSKAVKWVYCVVTSSQVLSSRIRVKSKNNDEEKLNRIPLIICLIDCGYSIQTKGRNFRDR